MPKFHHKLYILSNYLQKDLAGARQDKQKPDRVTDLAVATLGISLKNMAKAKRMWRTVEKSDRYYQNHSKGYCLAVAILVSKHKILSEHDYLKLKQATRSLDQDRQSARSLTPLRRPSLLSRIF